ncbi:MAG: hypothetical protein H7177_01260 [Rhizobacter sp.]|nr:hypothetical protein [Bacteriovorax sp.]
MRLILLFTILFSANLQARINHAPSNFQTSDGNVIFVDFKTGEYDITFDSKNKTVNVVSKITFLSDETGVPAFDLKENPTQMILDNEVITSKVISSPDKDTWFRIALKTIQPGIHTLIITAPIKEEVLFTSDGVSSAFWFSDLGDRGLLETYLPANFEYDQYKITLNLDFKNMSKQKIYTNGKISKFDNNKFKVEFPETYTSSSLYFHTAPIDRYPEILFKFRSIDGRDIPVTIYSGVKGTSLETAKTKTLSSLEGLESKYGPFLHSSVTIFIAGNGGMEYCGATMTDTWSLNHELTHSYFARGGFMPANGNAGWIDEAITTWSDEGSGMRPDMNAHSNMAGNTEYRRYTHSDAYSAGKVFMYYLNFKFQSSGGLTSFLNHLIQTSAFQPMTTEEFVQKMSAFYSEDMMPFFKSHVYTDKGIVYVNRTKPVHMKMTQQEMRQYL